MHLTPSAVEVEAGSPPGELVRLVNRGAAPAMFCLGPALVGPHWQDIHRLGSTTTARLLSNHSRVALTPPRELAYGLNAGFNDVLSPLLTAPMPSMQGGGIARNGLPAWLQAHPANGVITPGQTVALHLGAHPSQRSRPQKVRK